MKASSTAAYPGSGSIERVSPVTSRPPTSRPIFAPASPNAGNP